MTAQPPAFLDAAQVRTLPGHFFPRLPLKPEHSSCKPLAKAYFPPSSSPAVTLASGHILIAFIKVRWILEILLFSCSGFLFQHFHEDIKLL